VAARRARTKLREAEDAAQPHHEAVARMSATDRARAVELLHQAEALVAIPDPDEASTSLAAVRLAWAEFQADVEIDEAVVKQFESASEAVREAIEERRREAVAERERRQALEREQSDRVAIVTEIEQLGGPPGVDCTAGMGVPWARPHLVPAG